MKHKPKMTSALRRIPCVPQTTKVVSTNLYSKLKLEDLYDFDNEVKQKLLDKLYPAKSVDRHIFNHFLNQTFIVNGILSDRHKSLHHTHQQHTAQMDYVKRIQARYDSKNLSQRKATQYAYDDESEFHTDKRKRSLRYFQDDVNRFRKRRMSRHSSQSANKIYPSNIDEAE